MCKSLSAAIDFYLPIHKISHIICPDRTTLSTKFLVKHYESDNKIHQIVRYGCPVTDFQL